MAATSPGGGRTRATSDRVRCPAISATATSPAPPRSKRAAPTAYGEPVGSASACAVPVVPNSTAAARTAPVPAAAVSGQRINRLHDAGRIGPDDPDTRRRGDLAEHGQVDVGI